MDTKFFGLTGGIGSGKSTLANIFKHHDIPVLDLDQVGHIIINEDKEAQYELIQAFGERILNQQRIDRKRLAQIAFSSSQTTQTLNKIMHPRIQTYEETWRHKQHTATAIIEASVLIESGGVSRMNALLVVLCDEFFRWQRVKQRGNQSQQCFEQIVQQQCSDEERIKYADYIFDNNKSLEHLEQQAVNFLQQQTL
jgi:dephospho-CoA kinase